MIAASYVPHYACVQNYLFVVFCHSVFGGFAQVTGGHLADLDCWRGDSRYKLQKISEPACSRASHRHWKVCIFRYFFALILHTSINGEMFKYKNTFWCSSLNLYADSILISCNWYICLFPGDHVCCCHCQSWLKPSSLASHLRARCSGAKELLAWAATVEWLLMPNRGQGAPNKTSLRGCQKNGWWIDFDVGGPKCLYLKRLLPLFARSENVQIQIRYIFVCLCK